jgi:hypothetical protein
MYTFPRQRIAGRVILYWIRVVSKESLSVYISLSLQGNGSINTFPRQHIIVGGVILYAILIVSKENSLLVLPRIFCFYLF